MSFYADAPIWDVTPGQRADWLLRPPRPAGRRHLIESGQLTLDDVKEAEQALARKARSKVVIDRAERQ
jgi:hypothetical protein